MADKYWGASTGGSSTGTWDASSVANWFDDLARTVRSTVAPTSADNVFFDAGSDAGTGFTVTISTGAVCADITVSGLDQTMTLAGSATWGVYGSLSYPITNLIRTFTGAINFVGSGSFTITTNGVTLTTGTVTFNNAGGEWTLNGAFTFGILLQLSAGSFNTANFNITGGAFTTNSATLKTINFGSSVISLNGLNAINLFGSNLTLNSGTSQINCSAASVNFFCLAQTFYNVSFTSTAAGTATITGANTFNDLTFTSRAATGLRNISIGANQTVNGTLTLGTANTAIRRMFMFSDTIGTNRTITANAIATLADVDFRDITAAGASGTWSGTRLGNCLGNSNITFDAPKTVYRISTGNWSATQWALTSGGSVNANNFPLAQDDAVFDANTVTGTHTVDANWNIGGVDFSALNVAVTFATGTTTPTIYRNFILDADVTITGTGNTTFANQAGTQTIKFAGLTLDRPITKNGSGTLQLLDNGIIGSTRTLTHPAGTIDLNDFDLTTGLYSSTGSTTRQLDFGTGNLNVTGASFVASGSNFSTAATGSVSMNSASSKTFAGGGFSYPTLNQGGAGDLSVTGSNTFFDISNSLQPCTVRLPANTDTFVQNLSLSGLPGQLVSLRSTVNGQQFRIVKV